MTRRGMLSGGAALLLLPQTGNAQENAVKLALDAAAADPDPARALAGLARIDRSTLSTGRALDLRAARAGLAIDAEIRARCGIDPRAKERLPRNPALAVLLLRRKLGDVPSVDRATARLDAEIAACERRAATLFDGLKVRGASCGERFSALWRDERYLYPDDDSGRDRAVRDINLVLTQIRRAILPSFGAVPAYCLDVSARRSSPTTKPGTRTLPTPGQPGFYTVDLDSVRRRPAWTLPSVVAHELLPGHMLQMPMEAAAAPHPLRIDYAQGFPEGWGIYAEQAVATAGAYAGQPHGELGYLHWRLFRLGRARVDLGIHHEGMSVDAARAALVRWQGEPAYFAPFDSDLARIVADPMTRAAECLAALSIEDAMRGRAGGVLTASRHEFLAFGRRRSEELS